MTVIRRVFDLETRTLKGKERCYVGQPNDNLSTRIEIEYNPANALNEGWVPYIMFDMHHEDGTPFIYGPGSSPRFDGRTFEVPYEVMSRVRSQRLQYQLWLVKARVDWDGRIDELQAGGAEYLHSSIDGFAVKGGIRCRGPSDPCRPVNPCTDPSLMAWLTYFQTETLLHGIQVEHGTLDDGVTEGVSLYFPRYVENQGPEIVELRVPYLGEDGSLDISKYAELRDEWPDPAQFGERDLLTARLAYESLSYKTDKWMAIPKWDPTVRYSVGSTVVCIPEEDFTGEGVRFSPDVYIAKTASCNEDPRLNPDKWSTVTEQERVVASLPITQQYDSRWYASSDGDGMDDDMVPSAKLVDEQFTYHAIRDWSPEVSYVRGSTVIYRDNLFISICVDNKGHPPMVTVEDSEGRTRNGQPIDTTVLNDEYWARVSGDTSGTEMPTATKVYSLCAAWDTSGSGNTVENITTDSKEYVFKITHQFNTRSLFVQVKRSQDSPINPGEYVECSISTPTRSNIIIRLSSELSEKELKGLEVLVSPGGGRDVEDVMDEFVSKEMLISEKGRVIATLDEDGYITDDQLHVGTYPCTVGPTGDMLARYGDLLRVESNLKEDDSALSSRLDYLGVHKTDRTEFGPWNQGANYRRNAVVSRDTGIYVCLEPCGGVDPATDDGTHWKAVRFEEATMARTSARFGNAVDREYIIPHAMDTKDFVPAVRRIRDGRYMRELDIYAVDYGTVRVVIPEGVDPEPMVLNMCGCPKETSTLPSVGVHTVLEASDTWVLENPTRKPIFVQAFDSDGQLLYADVQQDPADSYDPVTVNLFTQTTGSAVYAPASKVVSFTISDLVEVEGGYDLVISKETLLQAGETDLGWYLMQGYSGTEGQFMADFIQDETTITVGLPTSYVEGLPEDWEGSVVLVKGSAFPIYEVEEWSFTLPSGTERPVGIQVYATGSGMVMGDMSCVDGTVSVTFSEPVSGHVVLL